MSRHSNKAIVWDAAPHGLDVSPEKEKSNIVLKQVVSKDRIAKYGEVYTRKREVNAMLDLVRQETERIDSRFLEPACGTGNFLIEILNRKLKVIEKRYMRSQLEFERYSVLAVGSIYGIDIQEDNIKTCRNRLFYLFDECYSSLYQKKAKEAVRKVIRFILSKNIIHGDALSLRTVGKEPKPIIFSEWSLVRGSLFKRRDFAFQQLIPNDNDELSLFSNAQPKSDQGKSVFIPDPVKEYPLTHFLRLPDEDIA